MIITSTKKRKLDNYRGKIKVGLFLTIPLYKVQILNMSALKKFWFVKALKVINGVEVY